MVDAMRAALDELMGRERDVPMDRRTNRKLRFDDPEVCKYAIAGLCPYGLFKNTKSDLACVLERQPGRQLLPLESCGDCKYELHEDDIQFDEIKEEYDMIPEKEKMRYGFQKELFLLLEKLVRDMDKKIERQRERAEKESEPRVLTADDQRRLDEILAREKEAQRQSEAMAEAGNVDGSMAMATQAESFHSQHDALHKSLTTPERIMTVCDICGVFINSTDNEQRRQVNLDHLTGKQYLGWKAIRDKYAELREKFQGRPSGALPPPPPIPEPGELERGPPSRHHVEGRSRERERERERDPRRDREHERDAERHRHHHRDRHREREAEYAGRERDSRDRHRRDSSHSRHRPRSRSRERDHTSKRRREEYRHPTGAEIPPPGWM